jgi:LL-H family phage holin
MDWMVFLSNFVQAFLMAAAPVLAVIVVKAAYSYGQKLAAQAKAAQPDLFEQLTWIAKTAVQAAEQSGAATLAEEKKAYAINYCEKWLESKGVTLDITAIDAAIEAAVWSEFNSEKPSGESVGFVK